MFPLFALPLPVFLDTTPETTQAPVLHLSDAVDAGLRNQPTLRQAHAQTVAAAERAKEVKSAWFPQLTGTASYTRVRFSSVGVGVATVGGTANRSGTSTTTGQNMNGIDVFGFGGSLSQLIWDFGQTSERFRAANRFTLSAEANERTAAYVVAENVRKNYFLARAQRALVEVARESLANFQRHLVQTEGFVKVGTQPEIALAQTRTDVANAQVALINAENSYLLAKGLLSQAMGNPHDVDFDVTDDDLPPVEGEDLSVDALVARALTSRPEILALERERDGQQYTVKSLKGAYGPTIAFNAGLSETATGLLDLGPGWSVGGTVTWPVFQGGLTGAQVREAEANVIAAQSQVDIEKLQVRVDVQTAALTLRAAKTSLKASEEALVNAREQLRLAEGRYATGVGSSIELGDAQVAYQNAEAQLIGARYAISSARAALLAALGRR